MYWVAMRVSLIYHFTILLGKASGLLICGGAHSPQQSTKVGPSHLVVSQSVLVSSLSPLSVTVDAFETRLRY